MKRIVVLVVLSLVMCSTVGAFQGGGGQSTKKGPTRTISAPHMRSQHREVLQTWLAAKPGWRPAVANDVYAGKDKQTRKYYKDEIQSMPNHPFYVADDFNGDGNQDFAVILIKQSGRSNKYAVAIFNGPFSSNQKAVSTFYSEQIVGDGDFLFWMKGDEFGSRFIIGPPHSDSGTLVKPRGKRYVVGG